MNKAEFTEQLRTRLQALPPNELDKSLSYYSEMIDDMCEDGMTEEEALAHLGDVEQIAQTILYDTPLPTLIKARVKQDRQSKDSQEAGGSKGSSHTVLLIILAVIGSPIWLPLLLAFGAILLSVYVVIWALVVTVYCVVFGIGVAGVAVVLSSAVLFLQAQPAAGIFFIGTGLILISITLFLIKPSIHLTKWLCTGTVRTTRWVKSIFIKKGDTKR